jgi:hypothetical protein
MVVVDHRPERIKARQESAGHEIGNGAIGE